MDRKWNENAAHCVTILGAAKAELQALTRAAAVAAVLTTPEVEIQLLHLWCFVSVFRSLLLCFMFILEASVQSLKQGNLDMRFVEVLLLTMKRHFSRSMTLRDGHVVDTLRIPRQREICVARGSDNEFDFRQSSAKATL